MAYLLKMGKCKQCGKCCEYWYTVQFEEDKEEVRFHDMHECIKSEIMTTVHSHAKYAYYAMPFACTNLTEDKKCLLHGKPEQPKMCKNWPFYPMQDYYRAVDGIFGCGYWFEEIEIETPHP
jgi:Fe-S-cluster containining protein